jgi:hypothetical protein
MWRRSPKLSNKDPRADAVDPAVGAAFGIAIGRQTGDSARFAAVSDDDNTNSLKWLL